MPPTQMSHASAQGNRPEQQDRVVLARIELPSQPGLSGQLLAVMDGHGGPAAVETLARELPGIFEESLRNQHDCILALRETVRQLAEKTSQEPSGSTLSTVFIPHDQQRVYVAVIGDSPILIRDIKDGLHIGPLHNARCNLKERTAAHQRGARYVGGYLEDPSNPGEGLQASRSLGDARLTKILNREADVFSIPIGKASWVLLASDGILQSFDRDITAQLTFWAVELDKGINAAELVELALKRDAQDNVTAIIWRA